MSDQFLRNRMVYGDSVDLLKDKHICIFGLGGVGGYVLESLARCGIGNFTIVDNDVVDITNLNRQIIALHENVGRLKVDVWEERLKEINPNVNIIKKAMFVLKENINEFDFSIYDYVVDAIDTVSAKLAIIEECKKADTLVISSMGTGNKINPMGFIVCDISKTEMDPLAKVVRCELRKRGINHVKVVYSKEQPKNTVIDNNGKYAPGSTPFVPSAAGLLIGSEVINDLLKK